MSVYVMFSPILLLLFQASRENGYRASWARLANEWGCAPPPTDKFETRNQARKRTFPLFFGMLSGVHCTL